MMAETIPPPAQSVDSDHHHHHRRHIGDVRDGGDDAALLLQSPEEGIPGNATITPDDDPIAVIKAALIRLKDDVGVLAEEDVVRAFSILQATDMPAFLRYRHAAKGANRDCSITVLDKLVREELPGGGEASILDELVALARAQCQLQHDADRKSVAIIPTPGRQEVWRVYSSGYEEWLRSAYWRAKETGVPETTMKSALATIAAAGINDGQQIDLHVRAAKDEAGYPCLSVTPIFAPKNWQKK